MWTQSCLWRNSPTHWHLQITPLNVAVLAFLQPRCGLEVLLDSLNMTLEPGNLARTEVSPDPFILTIPQAALGGVPGLSRFQRRNFRFTELEKPALGHTASKWQSLELNPGWSICLSSLPIPSQMQHREWNMGCWWAEKTIAFLVGKLFSF